MLMHYIGYVYVQGALLRCSMPQAGLETVSNVIATITLAVMHYVISTHSSIISVSAPKQCAYSVALLSIHLLC